MSVFYKLFGENPPTDGSIGYIELDGIDGFTDEDDEVRLDDSIEPGVKVHIKCSTW